jgi:hypothetical protein
VNHITEIISDKYFNHEFCLQDVYEKDDTNHTLKWKPLVCRKAFHRKLRFAGESFARIKIFCVLTKLFAGYLISSILVLPVIAAYAFIKELRATTHGKVVLCFATSSFLRKSSSSLYYFDSSTFHTIGTAILAFSISGMLLWNLVMLVESFIAFWFFRKGFQMSFKFYVFIVGIVQLLMASLGASYLMMVTR